MGSQGKTFYYERGIPVHRTVTSSGEDDLRTLPCEAAAL